MTSFENTALNRQERVAIAGEQDYYSTVLSSRMQAVMSGAGVLETRRTLPTITLVSNPIFLPGPTEQYVKAEILSRRIMFGGEVVGLALRRYDVDDSLSSSRSLSPDEYANAVKPRAISLHTPEGLMFHDGTYYEKKRSVFLSELEVVEAAVRSLRTRAEDEPEDTIFYNQHLFTPAAPTGDVALDLTAIGNIRLGNK